MTNLEIKQNIIDRCILRMSMGGIGSYIISSSPAIGGWTLRGQFNDNYQSTTTLVTNTYYLHQNTNGPGTTGYLPMKQTAAGGAGILKSFTANEVEALLGMLLHRITNDGLGQYRFSTSTPTAAGTWSEMSTVNGSATDAADRLQNIITVPFEKFYTGSYTGTYTGSYLVIYYVPGNPYNNGMPYLCAPGERTCSGISYNPNKVTYGGPAPANFTGTYTGTYTSFYQRATTDATFATTPYKLYIRTA